MNHLRRSFLKVIDLSGPLGLCIRARACSYGFENAHSMIQRGKCSLVLVDENASDKTIKRIYDKCNFYKVEIVKLDLQEAIYELNINENVKIISINDINFKKLIDKRLKGET